MSHELLSSARSSLIAGQRLAARTLLAAFIRTNPHNGEAWHLLSTVLDDPRQRADCDERAHRAGYVPPAQLPVAASDPPLVAMLVAYVRSLPDFTLVDTVAEPYKHMGATITDAILQAGLNYDTVVRPRVEHVRQHYPAACTTSDFLRLLEQEGPEAVIHWTHPEKAGRIVGVARFLQAEALETEPELARWLQEPANIVRLKKLRGIGDKTADYLKILVGLSASAVDRHLLTFLRNAGIATNTYAEAQHIINGAADLLGVDHTRFDLSIWTYVSKR